MAAPATLNLESVSTPHLEQSDTPPQNLGSTALLDIVQACLHHRSSEWIFLRELKVGTGFSSSAAQRLDAFALNCYAHTSMKRVCYEVKTSRADFLCEMKHPLKRRIGLRYSNEFYFVTPAGMLATSEIPIECGLIEIGVFKDEGRNSMLARFEDFAHFNTDHNIYCRVTVQAPWRETPGPTWQFVAGMLRNQQKGFQERPAKQPNQQRLPFVD
ncbi:MAG TPA: hypothetical protein VLJ11_04955 [Bryobacteraceae bacterium]|nr:hypothetical protein [Bryobacteraceae bacterium]